MSDAQNHCAPGDTKMFHIQPIKGSTNDPKSDPALTGEVPSRLSDSSSLDGASVFAQPGPVITNEQLSGISVASSEELDKRAAELNAPKPGKKP